MSKYWLYISLNKGEVSDIPKPFELHSCEESKCFRKLLPLWVWPLRPVDWQTSDTTARSPPPQRRGWAACRSGGSPRLRRRCTCLGSRRWRCQMCCNVDLQRWSRCLFQKADMIARSFSSHTSHTDHKRTAYTAPNMKDTSDYSSFPRCHS